MQKKSQLSWDFLITRYEIHFHAPIVETCCLLSTDLTPVFDSVGIGIFESIGIDTRCLIRECTCCTRRYDCPEEC